MTFARALYLLYAARQQPAILPEQVRMLMHAEVLFHPVYGIKLPRLQTLVLHCLSAEALMTPALVCIPVLVQEQWLHVTMMQQAGPVHLHYSRRLHSRLLVVSLILYLSMDSAPISVRLL